MGKCTGLQSVEIGAAREAACIEAYGIVACILGLVYQSFDFTPEVVIDGECHETAIWEGNLSPLSG